MTTAVQVSGLTRTFGTLTAVDRISFAIEQGEIFGLLGPNGAGKTTTLSMLSTLLEPTAGSAEIMGIDIGKDQDGVRKAIGIVFQDQSLDEELTAWENMDFHGRLYRIPKEIREKRTEELLGLVQLSDRKNDIVKTFSGGMRRRLEIARGLLHHPKVLFLDEPTLGLDPQTRNHIWTYIENLAQEKNITIILTTHYMEEADRLCDRIAIIDHGKIIALDTPARLKDSLGGDLITVRSAEPDRIGRALSAPWINRIVTRGNDVVISLQNADEHLIAVVTRINEEKIPVEAISIRKPTLEDVFLSCTGKSIRDEDANGKESMRMHYRMMRR